MGRSNDLVKEGRLIAIWFCPDELLRCMSVGSQLSPDQFLVGWSLCGTITLDGESKVLPDDATFIELHYDHSSRGMILSVAHESFEPVPYGESLPRWRWGRHSWAAQTLIRQDDGSYRDAKDAAVVATALKEFHADKQPGESSGDWFRRTMLE